MSVGRVIRHFEALGRVPIDIRDVLALVRDIQQDQTVRLLSFEYDPGILKGTCYRYGPTDVSSSSKDTSIALFNRMTDAYSQRLGACKELVHVMDPRPLWTNEKATVIDLFERVRSTHAGSIAAPLKPNDLGLFFDHLAKYTAMAILFPFSLREEIVALPPQKRPSLEKVSDWTEVPVDYIEPVLTPTWKMLRESLLTVL
jgi:hypothetical protein